MMDDLNSEYGFDSESTTTEQPCTSNRKRRDELNYKQKPAKIGKPDRSLVDSEKTRHMARQGLLTSMDAHTRHKHLINQYLLYYPGATKLLARDTSGDQNDLDVIRKNHKFVWDESTAADSWETKLAKRYWDKLFKEYCIADLSRYKDNKIGMRWRVEKEVLDGKGQFVCGNKKCTVREGLESWEVNFGYVEDGFKKNALVKLRLCASCSKMLNYHQQRKKVSKVSKKKKKSLKSKSEQSDEPNDSKSIETVNVENDEDDIKSTDTSEPKTIELPASADAWKQTVVVEEERTRDDDFEDFLDDLLV